jgi:ribose transport system substrate-binding protein
LFALVCVALLSALLAACGSSSSSTSGDSTSNDTTAEEAGGSEAGGGEATPVSDVEGEELTIGVSNYAGILPFYQAMTAGIEEQAGEYGWSVEVTDSKFDPNKQLSDVQTLITRGADVIVISPANETALLPAYQEAAAKGVPIISIANRLTDEGAEFESAFYGLSYEELYGLAAENLIEAIGGKGQVAQINGPKGILFVTEAEQGAKAAFEGAAPEIEAVFSQNAKELSAAEGLRMTQIALTKNPQIAGVWANDDELAVGVHTALQEKGLAGKVMIAWAGGTAQTMDLAAEGALVGPVVPTYTWGTGVVEKIHGAVAEGEEFAGAVDPPFIELTSAKQAQELIDQCPEEPSQLWCLGRE